MKTLVRVAGLTKRFHLAGRGELTAVDRVDLDICYGETLGVVGESGCGKTTLARCILRLIRPTAGMIEFDGTDITRLSAAALRPIRRRMQIVFQDPVGSLNPRLTVRSMLHEPMKVHDLVASDEIEARSVRLLEQVGLDADALDRYPHEFSAGQRQRLGIARALTMKPQLIIADEPVSALDVSVRAQVINLLTQLQDDLELTYLFISHDLQLVQHVSDRVAVMYLGRIVEVAPAQRLYAEPVHPYSRALLAATPRLDRPFDSRARTMSEPASSLAPPPGCHFHPRCPIAEPRCRSEAPVLLPIDGECRVACHLAE